MPPKLVLGFGYKCLFITFSIRVWECISISQNGFGNISLWSLRTHLLNRKTDIFFNSENECPLKPFWFFDLRSFKHPNILQHKWTTFVCLRYSHWLINKQINYFLGFQEWINYNTQTNSLKKSQKWPCFLRQTGGKIHQQLYPRFHLLPHTTKFCEKKMYTFLSHVWGAMLKPSESYVLTKFHGNWYTSFRKKRLRQIDIESFLLRFCFPQTLKNFNEN